MDWDLLRRHGSYRCDYPCGSNEANCQSASLRSENMHQLVMRRLARFYWTSLATSGSTPSRVAAALVSRLSLSAEDHGQDRTIYIRQKDLGRLTTLSRSAVADGLSALAEASVISFGNDRSSRFAGECWFLMSIV